MDEIEFKQLTDDIQTALNEYHRVVKDTEHYVPVPRPELKLRSKIIVSLQNMNIKCNQEFYLGTVLLDETATMASSKHISRRASSNASSVGVQPIYTTAQKQRVADHELMESVQEHIRLSKIRNRLKYIIWRIKELTPKEKTVEQRMEENTAMFMKGIQAAKGANNLMEYANEYLEKSALKKSPSPKGQQRSKRSP
eukprot:PhF_6_TR37805/c0_g1_i1/m.56286